ncbi:MAG: septal ring lytic transglycosylase RlpA family protein [Desulfobacterales bacterium]|nr:septal ring lytic transglycosylase RlpA family protein [Desulfobacterales bacterium]
MRFEFKEKLPISFQLIAILSGLVILVNGCSKIYYQPGDSRYPKPYKVMGTWYQPLSHANDFIQRGIASWYGKKFHGKKTSSGEVYNMYAMTAAHKTLPLGTYVRVHNLNNGKKIEVRINDRGPFVRGRIIDLSQTAARELEIFETGTAPVEITALGKSQEQNRNNASHGSYAPLNYYAGNFSIQVGAFTDYTNATRLKQKLDQSYKNAHIMTYCHQDETIYRVRVGKCSTLNQAIAYEKIMIQNGFKDAFTIAE